MILISTTNCDTDVSKGNRRVRSIYPNATDELTVAFCKIQQYHFLAMHLLITLTIYRYKIIFHYYFLVIKPSPYFTHPTCF